MVDLTRAHVRAFAPGRTEIAGNHTDHQGGRVVAAAVDCGIDLLLQPCEGQKAYVSSDGFEPVEVDLADVSPRADEAFTTAALVRGVVAGMREAGVGVGGFAASAKSGIPAGGGLSSSAAFELALGQALNAAFGEGEFAPEQLARIGQEAERTWFGKPCGLMDQMAIALGGVQLMDFADGGCVARSIDFDFESAGLALFLIDTHCDHSAYTLEYAQVAKDMDAVAHFLGANMLSEVSADWFFESFGRVRAEMGDVPALRALHYYHEMALVDRRAQALAEGDVAVFLAATRQSGASSAQYLQNVSTADRVSQPAMVALALADCLASEQGAVRIHGGGFGGTVQAFVPVERADEFALKMDELLGTGSCRRYRISACGAHAEWVF